MLGSPGLNFLADCVALGGAARLTIDNLSGARINQAIGWDGADLVKGDHVFARSLADVDLDVYDLGGMFDKSPQTGAGPKASASMIGVEAQKNELLLGLGLRFEGRDVRAATRSDHKVGAQHGHELGDGGELGQLANSGRRFG